jgi:predicted RNA binding protein YcfA (HicA-like mRNA interferase family)
VRAREVDARIGVQVTQRGSHRKYLVRSGSVSARTTVPQHTGDLPIGTVREIERDLEAVLGRRWLLR